MKLKQLCKTGMLIAISLIFSSVLAVETQDESYNYNYAELNNNCQIYDPYEPINRKIFIFNAVLDTFILSPVARIYGKLTNDYTKDRVDNFLNNVQEPLSVVNYTIQGNVEGVLKTFWRFTINSTFGVVGLFDVANKVGLSAAPQTFSNTLAHYGVGPGPYIIVPFIGGMPVREIMDALVLNNSLNPLTYATHKDFNNIVTVAKTIHIRNKMLPFTDYVSKNSTDPYISIRDAILNERESKAKYPVGFICPKVSSGINK